MAHLLISHSSLSLNKLHPSCTPALQSRCAIFDRKAKVTRLQHLCFGSNITSLHKLVVGNKCAPWRGNQSTALHCSGPGSREGAVKEEEEDNHTNSMSWIDKYFPRWLAPYAHLIRLDKPIGVWLFAYPYFWAIALAAPVGSLPDLKMLSFFGLEAALIRGAACTVNDFFDRDIDKKVQRTKKRPLAYGTLTPFQGLSFLAFQLILQYGMLLQLNNLSHILGASSLLLLGYYPLLKRFTFWPQAYLGLSISWGALIGWTAIKGSLDIDIIFPLYVSGIFWTLIYDTIYAHQDKEDDLKVGVKSTALRFGDRTKNWLSVFGVACIISLALSGFNAGLGWPFYVGIIAATIHLFWQILTVDISSPTDCNIKFVSNIWFGALVFGGILLGRLSIG